MRCKRCRCNPWAEKIPWSRKWSNSFQYSSLENSMDRGAWRATVHGAAESQTRLSTHFFYPWKSPARRAVQRPSGQKWMSRVGSLFNLVRCLKHRGFFTVGNKDVCKVNLWDPARVSRNTGKTPLDQVCRCRAMERALTIHHPWYWQPHWFEGAQTRQIYLGWGVYCRYNNSKWTKNVK